MLSIIMYKNIKKKNGSFRILNPHISYSFSNSYVTNNNKSLDKKLKDKDVLYKLIQRLTKEFQTMYKYNINKQDLLMEDIANYFNTTKSNLVKIEDVQQIIDELISHLTDEKVEKFKNCIKDLNVLKVFHNLIVEVQLSVTGIKYINNKVTPNVSLTMKLASRNVHAFVYIVLTEIVCFLPGKTKDFQIRDRNELVIKLGLQLLTGLLYQWYIDSRGSKDGTTKYPTVDSIIKEFNNSLSKEEVTILLKVCNAESFKQGLKSIYTDKEKKCLESNEVVKLGDWVVLLIFKDIFEFKFNYNLGDKGHTLVGVTISDKYVKIFEYLSRYDSIHIPRFIKAKEPKVTSNKYISYEPYNNLYLDSTASLFIKSINNDLGEFSMNTKLNETQEKVFKESYIPVVNLFNSIPFKVNRDVLKIYKQFPSIVYQDNIWYIFLLVTDILEESKQDRNNLKKLLDYSDIRGEDTILKKTLNSVYNVYKDIDFLNVPLESLILLIYFLINNLRSVEPISDKTVAYSSAQLFLDLDSNKCTKDLSSDLSRYNQNTTVIYIAQVTNYIDYPFYLPILFDWRGRIYTINTFLTYQGSDFAKSLLLFNNKKAINKDSLEYYMNTFKIYGANLYGHTLVSYDDRCQFINKLLDEIVSADYNFIFKSKEPYCFLAWALEYTRILREIDDGKIFIETSLPIYSDASCNGIQHLSLKVKDSITAAKVNLLPKTGSDKPTDIYTEVTKNVNKLIKESKQLSDNCKGLQLVRSEVKLGVMTIPYGATIYGIGQSISEKLSNRDIPIKISDKDSFVLALFVKDSVSDPDSPVSKLIDYLTEMTDILNKLNVPVLWKLNRSVTLAQSYKVMNKKTVKTTLNTQYTIYERDLTKLDTRKQKAAIVPNLVLSSDAAVILNLIHKINQYKPLKEIDVVTVLDCFVTQLPNVQQVKDLVALATIDLYFVKNKDYIINLLELWIWYIETHGYMIVTDDLGNTGVMLNEEDMITLPNPPKSGDLKVEDIIQAIYMIQ